MLTNLLLMLHQQHCCDGGIRQHKQVSSAALNESFLKSKSRSVNALEREEAEHRQKTFQKIRT